MGFVTGITPEGKTLYFKSAQTRAVYKRYLGPLVGGSNGTSGGGRDFSIEYQGFRELTRRLNALDREFNEEMRRTMPLITRDFRVEAQKRSPYLYGVLKNAHRDAAKFGNDGIEGGIYLDPMASYHPILGGYPYEYGKELHDEGTDHVGPRPWFAWTIEDMGDSILSRYEGRIADVFMIKN